MTRAYNTATTQQNSGGAVAGVTAGKNPVLNSAFNVWQRGTSFSLAASTAYTSGFVADRFQTGTGANQACTISRQATGDSTNLPFIQYALRYQRNSGQTGTGGLFLVQNFETVNSIPFAGKTVTFSFYARAGANYSMSNNNLTVVLRTGTGTDQNLITAGYTGSADVVNTFATLTTTWQRFTYTGSVASNVTEMGILFGFTPTGTAGANDWYEITGIQLEVGSVATPYAPYSPTYQGELAACQRYYWRFTATAGGANYLCLGRTTSQVDVEIQHPVQMRTSPTALEYGGTLDVSDINVAGYNCSSLSFANASVLFASIRANTQASLAQGKTYVFGVQTNAYYGFSAEL